MEWNYPGSKWWKIDFHVHTPESDDYGRGDMAIKTGTTEEIWLKKAMEAELDCVVVTDHNTGGWINRLKAKYVELMANPPEWFREIVLFPGVEISVANETSRIHLLGIFDPTQDSSKITATLGACGISEGFGDDTKTSTTTGFSDTVDIIIRYSGLPIPAHIDGTKGFLCGTVGLTEETKRNLSKLIAAEFCDVSAYASASLELRNSLKEIACIAGSDAHKPDDIGKHYSWVKMSKPTIDGLRLALQDREYCVRNVTENPNAIPDVFIESLMIKNMVHCGRIVGSPLVIPFHPHFNSIIGGRGTGKSTVIESIRISTRRDTEVVELDNIKKELESFMKPHKQGVMLPDTEILLRIHRRGKSYRLRWRFDGKGAVLEEYSNGVWVEGEAGNLTERFPLNIFSQKQINALASNPKGLIEIIDRAPEVQKSEWKQRWENTKSKYLQLKEKQRELGKELAQEPQIRIALADVENDLKQYEEKGYGDILKSYQKRNEQILTYPLDDNFDGFAENIRIQVAEAGAIDLPEHLFTEDESFIEVKAIHDETLKTLEVINQELLELANRVDELSANRKNRLEDSAWYKNVQVSVEKYEELRLEYESKSGQFDLNAYSQWVQKRGTLQQQIARMDVLKKEYDVIQKTIQNFYNEFVALRGELLERRKVFINSVISGSQYVRMELVQYGDASGAEAEFRSIFGFEGSTFASSILDEESKQSLLYKLNFGEKTAKPLPLFDLIENMKSDTMKIAEGKRTASHGAFANRLMKLYEDKPMLFDQLQCWWPEDQLVVRYARDPKTDKFDDLEKGSAGQKAAAILAFLLNYGKEPLIIDQPEDDLDNTLIYDLVVRQIKLNKGHRQIIMVTHNPNIVVNGDSELVSVLKFTSGQIALEENGGLEEKTIREAVCIIMEGGEDAFKKRYNRIMQGV